ncbi:MAG: hypothetical protein GY810_07420 [Aureispira sp.]|nr:hypothetical protein [Aureispira sp.]
MNAIVDQYNNTRTWLDTPMPKIKFLDGFHVGIHFTYKIPFELMWAGRYKKMTAEGTPSGQQKGSRTLNLQYHGLSLGLIPLRLKKLPLGLGFSFDFNVLKFDTKLSDQAKEKVLQQFNFASSMFFTAQFPLFRHLTIDIRPYIQVPIGKVDLYPLEQKLDPQNSAKHDPSLFRTNFLNVGGSISIVYTFWTAQKKKKEKKISQKPLIHRVKTATFCADLESLLSEKFDNLIVEGTKQPKKDLAGALDAQLGLKKRQIQYTYARKFTLADAQKNYSSLIRRVQKCLKKDSYSSDEQILAEGQYQTRTFYIHPSPDKKVSTISILYTVSADGSYADVDLILVYS